MENLREKSKPVSIISRKPEFVNHGFTHSFDTAQHFYNIGFMKMLALADLLYSQGFGTRRVCAGLVQQGWVQVAGQTITDAAAPIAAEDGLAFSVQGQDWRYYESAVIVLNKPAGHECSQKPSAWPSVYSLLPMRCACARAKPSKLACKLWDA